MTNYIELNWKTEEKFNIGSKCQPSVYNNVDNLAFRKLPRHNSLDMETIVDFFSGGGSDDFSNKYRYDYLNICEIKYTEFYSSTIEALNFLNPRSYYELYEKSLTSSVLAGENSGERVKKII